MERRDLRDLLTNVREGKLAVDAALERLRDLPAHDLEFAVVDHHRALRCGFPEVILAEGKRVDQVVAIARDLADSGSTVLATRLLPEQAEALGEALPDGVYHALARAFVWRPDGTDEEARRPEVVVVTAGTSDLPVAEEAAVTAEVMGTEVTRVNDVGVAGIHRMIPHLPRLGRAAAVVVVAGMEGALASVIGGLIDRPVIAVPTSVGYGAAFGGLAALLGMLNSCAAGVTVVNIDNGFGAGVAAARIALQSASEAP